MDRRTSKEKRGNGILCRRAFRLHRSADTPSFRYPPPSPLSSDVVCTLLADSHTCTLPPHERTPRIGISPYGVAQGQTCVFRGSRDCSAVHGATGATGKSSARMPCMQFGHMHTLCVCCGWMFRDTTEVDQDPKGHPVNTPLWRSSDGPVRPLGDAFIKACEHSTNQVVNAIYFPIYISREDPRR